MVTGAVVIGSGFGGLCAAFRLQAAGIQTTLLERRSTVGGKARNVAVAGGEVPGGPTVLTLRWVFDELFASVGQRLEDHVHITPLEKLAHYRWSADERLDVYHDVERTAEAIKAFAGQTEADGYRRFVADSARIFGIIEKTFIRAPKPDIVAIARAVGPLGARTIKPFDTMWSALGRHFRDQRLKQLFGRFATYCGSSPFAVPATLMLLAHAEQSGVFAVEGGTAGLASAIAGEFQRMGGELRTGVGAKEIAVRNGVVQAVELDGGSSVPAELVIFCGDPSAMASGHLGRRVATAAPFMAPKQRSLSAVTLCGTLGVAEPLGHHTVAFGANYKGEFDALFQRRSMPSDPTIYICAPHEVMADGAQQRVLIVMNAPANGDQHNYGQEDIAQCQEQAMAALSRCGLGHSLSNCVVATPNDFADLAPATGGAIYGRVSHGWTASFQRPIARTKVRGLYLAGGSVHPGPGMPMAALSGQMAAQYALTDFAFSLPSRQPATFGGISTA
ncbi:MAG: phytoene desaturase family protein [Pseudomonadota bacterium]